MKPTNKVSFDDKAITGERLSEAIRDLVEPSLWMIFQKVCSASGKRAEKEAAIALRNELRHRACEADELTD